MYGKAGVGGGGGGFGRGGGGGGFGGGSHTFNFGGRSANDIFKDAFGDEDPFADFEKEFAKGSQGGGSGGGPRVRVGGMGGASSSFSSSFSFSMGSGGGAQRTMQRSETRIDGSGRRVTKTVKTGPNGETEAEMELDDGQGNVRSRKVAADEKKAKPESLDDKEAKSSEPPADPAKEKEKEPETPPPAGSEGEKPKKKKTKKKKKPKTADL